MRPLGIVWIEPDQAMNADRSRTADGIGATGPERTLRYVAAAALAHVNSTLASIRLVCRHMAKLTLRQCVKNHGLVSQQVDPHTMERDRKPPAD